jgi:hypothetical protein
MSLKRLCMALAITASVLVATPTIAEEAPDSVRQIIPSLQEWGTNPILVAGVREQNALGRSLDDIKRLDEEWMAESGVTPFMDGLQNNAPAQELKRLEGSKPYFMECFIMDNQGANVAMTNKTSDFWQGDEDKFTESYKGGQGAVHIGDVKFDKSSQIYLVQVSIPVIDAGKAIGALTVGIDLDALGQAGK